MGTLKTYSKILGFVTVLVFLALIRGVDDPSMTFPLGLVGGLCAVLSIVFSFLDK